MEQQEKKRKLLKEEEEWVYTRDEENSLENSKISNRKEDEIDNRWRFPLLENYSKEPIHRKAELISKYNKFTLSSYGAVLTYFMFLMDYMTKKYCDLKSIRFMVDKIGVTKLSKSFFKVSCKYTGYEAKYDFFGEGYGSENEIINNNKTLETKEEILSTVKKLLKQFYYQDSYRVFIKPFLVLYYDRHSYFCEEHVDPEIEVLDFDGKGLAICLFEDIISTFKNEKTRLFYHETFKFDLME